MKLSWEAFWRWFWWFIVFAYWVAVLVTFDKYSNRFAVFQGNIGTIILVIFMSHWVTTTLRARGAQNWNDFLLPAIATLVIPLALLIAPFVNLVQF